MGWLLFEVVDDQGSYEYVSSYLSHHEYKVVTYESLVLPAPAVHLKSAFHSKKGLGLIKTDVYPDTREFQYCHSPSHEKPHVLTTRRQSQAARSPKH